MKGTLSSQELLWLDLEIGRQNISSINGLQGHTFHPFLLFHTAQQNTKTQLFISFVGKFRLSVADEKSKLPTGARVHISRN